MSIVAQNHTGRCIIVLTFDDGEANQHDVIFPILEEYHLKGTFYVISSLIGETGSMTVAQLQEMYAAGHDIGNHTSDHTDLNTLTQGQQETKLDDCRDFLVTNEMPRAATHVSYPHGANDASTLLAMAAQGMETGRTTSAGNPTSPPVAVYQLPTRYFSTGAEGIASQIATIESAIAAKACVLFTFHTAELVGSGDAISVADFEALCAYIRAADCECMTISQWFANLSGAVTLPDDLTKGATFVNQASGFIPTKFGATWAKGPYTYLT